MKRKNINVMGLAFSALLCLFLVDPASAQRGSNGGGGNNGGGGGSHPSGGGGGGAVRSAPASSGSRPSFNSAPRSSVAPQRGGNAPQAGAARVYAPRQGVGPGQRGVSATVQVGLAARPGYRSYPGLPGSNGVTRIGGGGRGRPYAGYYNSHGYYNSFYAPHLGFRLNVLPYGYYPFWWGANQFYYSDGLYYQYMNNQYQVVEPPVGAAITTLPDNSQSIVINGIQYYELNGVYYQPITKDDGTVVYQVAGKDGELNTDDGSGQMQGAAPLPQIGDIVTTLPENTRTIKINGQKLYVSQDDYYYQDARDSNNNKVYKIVGTPSDEPGSNQ